MGKNMTFFCHSCNKIVFAILYFGREKIVIKIRTVLKTVKQTVHKKRKKNSFEVESTDATNNPLICKDDINGKNYKSKNINKTFCVF